jgi:hypothetical protein
MLIHPRPAFKATVQYGILQTLRYIKEQDPSVDTNGLFRYLMSEEKAGENDFAVAYSILHKILFAGYKPVLIHNRPKPGCAAGECYVNSYYEWKTTGNKPLLVMEVWGNNKLYSMSPHACNITHDGVVYDTDNFQYGKKGRDRMAFILKEPKDMIPWIRSYCKDPDSVMIPTLEFGDWMIITKGESAWAVHCKKDRPGCDDCKITHTTMSHFNTEDVLDLVKDELEMRAAVKAMGV